MGTALTAAQRRAVTGSDPATGRLGARADVCAALVARGLAVPHSRAGHHSYYLSPQGLRLRADLTAAQPGTPPAGRAEPAADTFTADDGTGTEASASTAADRSGGAGPSADPDRSGGPGASTAANRSGGAGPSADAAAPGGARRAAEVATAWEGLLRIRALLLDGATDVPAPWERDRAVHAVALALEAAGCPPAGTRGAGYTVTAGGQGGLPEVAWRGAPDAGTATRALARCADLLGRFGWQCTEHRTRAGAPFLVASPRRAR